ncbi:MAG: tetratricopeptide repeat protein [Planctomycetes bacterium]|nr:tetratricopeptide repeat protein [Planctomycetota bacterium]
MTLTRWTTARRTPKTTVLGALAALFLTAVPAFAQDTVTLKDGKTEQGRVKSADYEGLTIENKGQAKTIEWSTVAGVAFKDPPDEYTAGRDSFDQSKWDDALASFDKLKADSKLRAPIRQDAFYLAASVQLAKGNWDGAIAGFDALRKEFPKSRYLIEAGEGYVTAFSAKKDYAGASKALDTLSNEAAVAGVPAGFNAAVSLLKGRLLEDQGKTTEAAAAYGVAEKATGAPLVVLQQARLGQGRCLLAQKTKNAEAEAIFRKLTGEDASNLVLAGAWNGLGDLWMLDAMSKGEAEKIDKINDAAFAYMRGVVQYGPGPSESAREYKRSLEGSMRAFQALSQVEKNADRKKVYQQRYLERKEQLEREFPGGK